ncbi:MAG: tetratricopeptide repeat protein [Gammaproteobacteria bacterium]|nr:tetratricopeptide repeat protein [Gammaproteobacteria bacterium]
MNLSHNRIRSPLMIVACLLLALTAQAQETAPKINNPKVGKPLQAAIEAYGKKQWDVALTKLDEADRAEKKSPYEQFAINEYKATVLVQKRQYAEAAPLLERNMDSGFIAASDMVGRLEQLLLIHMQLRNYAKVVPVGERWLKVGGSKAQTRALLGQAYYAQKNYRKSIDLLGDAIDSVRKAGGTPDENWLNIVRSSYQNLGDTDGAGKAMTELVRYYPKPDYWAYLLDSRIRQKNTDRVQLNLFRLARQVGIMDSPDEYVEMTEILLEAGLPAEASSVMEAGYAAKVFDNLEKSRADRYKRRRDEAKTAAAKDQQSLPAFEREAQKSPTGQYSVALGLTYASLGQHEKAAPALTAGLQKGGVLDPQQAQMTLGIAHLKLGRRADAIKAFEQVKADPAMEDVAKLWVLAARSGS